MTRVIVDKEFWELFPEAQISTLTIHKIDNHVYESDDPYFAQLLKDGAQESKKFIENEVFRDNEVVDEWRQAFRKFKTKKGARCSIEAIDPASIRRATEAINELKQLVEKYFQVTGEIKQLTKNDFETEEL